MNSNLPYLTCSIKKKYKGFSASSKIPSGGNPLHPNVAAGKEHAVAVRTNWTFFEL